MDARAVRGRVATALVTLCTLALVALPSLAGLGVPEAHAVEPAGKPAATVAITGLSPIAVTPDSTVTVDVRVENPTAEELTAPRVDLSIVRYRISTRSALDAWYLDDQFLVTPGVVARTDLDVLAPGASRTVRLTVSAEALGLLPYPEASGPRGLVVDLSDGGRPLDDARTFLLWFPTGVEDPMAVSILAPITTEVAGMVETRGQELATELGPGGRLDALLEATRAHPGVTWAVDPALVEDAAAGAAGDAGTLWARGLLQAAVNRDVYALDPFDPDVSALAHAGVEAFLTTSTRQPASALTTWREDLTLPGPGVVDQETLAAAVRADRGTVVLDAGPQPGPGEFTADAVATVPTAAGPVRTLQPDGRLSALLGGDAPAQARSAFEARQLLLAELAVVSLEDAGPAHLLLATDRDWHPAAADTSAALEAIALAPFLDLQELSAWDEADRQVLSSDAPELVVHPGEVAAGALRRATVLAGEAGAVAAVAAEPAALMEPYLRSLAAASSVALRGEDDVRDLLLDTAQTQGEALATGLTVVEGSTVNLIAASGDLPITLRNDLVQPVTVGVGLQPSDPRLSAETSEQVTIEAGATGSVTVPVTAIGSGDVTVQVQVLAADGTVVAAPAEFTVRVRADWETTGTAVVGAGLVVLLVIGITRTVRRGRSTSRMAPMRAEDSPA